MYKYKVIAKIQQCTVLYTELGLLNYTTYVGGVNTELKDVWAVYIE